MARILAAERTREATPVLVATASGEGVPAGGVEGGEALVGREVCGSMRLDGRSARGSGTGGGVTGRMEG